MTEQHPMFAAPKASLPYGGTAGSSGSTASGEMAEREASDGTMADRQARILTALSLAGPMGRTVVDLRDGGANHHGKTSSALTALHKDGRIARLVERRDRSSVYVLPEHVEGRAHVPPGGNKEAAAKHLSPPDVEFVARVAAGVRPRTAPNTLMLTATVKRLLDMIEYLNG
jgi:hypothetical protein